MTDEGTAASPERDGETTKLTSPGLPADDSEIDWSPIRVAYEAGALSLNAISARHGVTRGTIEERARLNKWNLSRRDTGLEHRLILHKLFWGLERQADYLQEMELTGSLEQEGVVLHKLAQTLDRLIAMDAKTRGRKLDQRESREAEELRAKISKRIDELQIR